MANEVSHCLRDARFHAPGQCPILGVLFFFTIGRSAIIGALTKIGKKNKKTKKNKNKKKEKQVKSKKIAMRK